MSTFVGRTDELRELRRSFERAEAGDGNTVFVTGGAGAGKTSLVEQFLLNVSVASPETQVAVGDASEQYGSGEPYQPFVEAFEGLVGKEGPAGEPTRKEKLTRLAREVAPYWLSAIPMAGNLVAAVWETAREVKETVGSSTATASPPNEETLFYQYTELLFAAAEEEPVVLFLDDLHWADEASCSLLSHLARRVDDRRVLIVGTYRPEDVEVAQHPIKKTRQELERYGVARRIELQALERISLAELVENELGAPPSVELLHFLESRAGSNPLFFTELLQWVVERDLCRKVGGEWQLEERPEEIEVPRSAESTIEKRLDRLDEEVRHFLEYASVQGDEFDSTVLARLLEVDELELEERLQDVVNRHRLIKPTGERDFPSGDFATVYRFRHSLIQDILHRNLFGKRKVLLHRKAAAILEELYQEQTGPVAYALAVHYDQGRQPEKAFEAALRAADRAAGLYAHTDAIELLERARKHVPGKEDEIQVLERLAEQHRILGRFPRALHELGEAIEIARELGDSRKLLSLRHRVLDVELDFGRKPVGELEDELTELAEEARRQDEPTELCRILLYHRRLPRSTTEPTLEALLEARQIAREQMQEGLVAQVNYTLGAFLARGLDPEGAMGYLSEALRVYERQENRMYVGHCHNALAVAHSLLGDYGQARGEFEAACQAFDEIGDPVESSGALNNLGVVLLRTGEWEEASNVLRKSLELARRMDATPRLLSPCENLARLHREKGELDRAREYWKLMMELARSSGYWTEEAVARAGLGLVHLREGRVEEAREALTEARSTAGGGDEWWEGRPELDWLEVRLAAETGEWGEASEAAEEAAARLEGRDPYLWAMFRLLEGEVLSRFDGDRAATVIEEAAEAFRDVGATRKLRQAEDLLGRIRNEKEGDEDAWVIDHPS